VLIASLEGQSLVDTIRQAISELIERKRGNGDLAAQAAKALEEMDQETQARNAALQALLGSSGPQTGQQPTGTPTPSRGRPRRNGPAS
jgi:hypothetical protein